MNQRPAFLKKVIVWALIACAGLPAVLGQKPAPEAGPEPTRMDVPYGPEPAQILSFWAPKGRKPAPLIVYIPGGAWQRIDGNTKTLGRCKSYWDNGFAVAIIQYRLAPGNPLPKPVMDAARALQFLKSRGADWDIAPDQIALFGLSAGACTALFLATHDDLADPSSADPVERQSTRVQAVVAGMAQTTILPDEVRDWVGPNALNHGMVAGAGGFANIEKLTEAIKRNPEVEKLYREFSPIHHLSPDDPPILLEYGNLAPPLQGDIHDGAFGVKFAEKSKAIGARCHLSIYKNPEYPPFPGGATAFVLKALAEGDVSVRRK